jgi:hypothetical protein
MTIFTLRKKRRSCVRTLGLAIAAWAMTSISMGNTLVIPTNLVGQGAEQIVGNVGFPSHYPPQCYSGFGSPQIGPTCTLTETGQAGQPNQGAMSGSATAYQDATGLHASVDLGASGTETSYAEALSYYTDTVTNNTFGNANIQFGFAVDANLTASGSGAFSYLEIQFLHGGAGSDFDEFGGPGAQPALQSWGYSGNVSVNLNALTNAITLAPGASYTFSLTLDADVNTIQEPGQVAIDGPPTASVDAMHTLTLTAFSAEDGDGNALPASDFSSADGADYGSIDIANVPEPSTFGLCGACVVLLLVGACVYNRSSLSSTGSRYCSE